MAESPEDYGWDTNALEEAYDYADDINLAAVMVVDDGRLVSAWGCTKTRWYIASTRKSLMSAVIGQQVSQGRLALDTTLADLDIEDPANPLSPEQRNLPMERFVTSSSGICRPSAAGSNCTPDPVRTPGTFVYNNWDFNVLASVVQRASGEDFFTTFARDVAQPIGMDFVPDRDGRYTTIEASPFPAYVMKLSADDMARFGLLYQRGGVWRDQQVVPREWVEVSTRAHLDTNRTEAGHRYGYLWWVQDDQQEYPLSFPAGTSWAEGNWRQFIMVVWPQKLVFVVRGHIPSMWMWGRTPTSKMRVLFERLLAAKTTGDVARPILKTNQGPPIVNTSGPQR